MLSVTKLNLLALIAACAFGCSKSPVENDALSDLPSVSGEADGNDEGDESGSGVDQNEDNADGEENDDTGDDETDNDNAYDDETDDPDEDIEDDETTEDDETESGSGDSEDEDIGPDDDSVTDGTVSIFGTDLPTTIPPSGTSGVRVINSEVAPSGVIADINVMIDLEHTCTKDLTAILQSPEGTTVVFMDLTRLVVCSSDLIGTKLDDEATILIVDGDTPFTGRFRPTAALSEFDGENAAGEWTLIIEDDTVVDHGRLIHWEMEITFE